MPDDRPRSADDEAPSPADVVARHEKLQRRTERALLLFGLALVTLVVVHNPAAWGDGHLAALIRNCAWALLVVGGLVAYIANGRMAEQRGYCLGKYGALPNALSRKSATDPQPPTRG